MNSFVFNSFKKKFLNGDVPSSFNATFLPMNDKFINNFSKNGFSVEQFSNVSDLEAFSANAFDESKLDYVGIKYTWSKVEETDEQIKPMYINDDNFSAFSASDYWSDCTANASSINEYKNSGFYVLRTKEELNWFANSVNEGNNGIIGVLFDDVSDKLNARIGKDDSVPFQGILDGNGHALHNSTIVCSGNDNGLVGVLGSHGQVKNFMISNDAFTGVVLNSTKQINLNYLKKSGSDINCGVLVGKNYGTISNICLSGDDGYKFSFSGFVPQVYTVTNKSDDISNFNDVRSKFDNGENFYFLNSWCINSPGNICPYVGYFAEGIFAQQSYGYNSNNELRAIDFNPKVKPYYHTGTEVTEIDTSDESKFTLLGIYVKYDWFHDYLMDPTKTTSAVPSNDALTAYSNKNILDYVINDRTRSHDDSTSKSLNHYIFDNLSFRKIQVATDSASILGLSTNEIESIKADPAWLSFNDDPKGRNAVAIVKYAINDNDYIVLELNGVLTYSLVGKAIHFRAGALNVSNLPSPVLYSFTDDDKSCGYEIDLGDRKALVSNGYIMADGSLYKSKTVDERTPRISFNGILLDENNFDTTDSVRAFTRSGNEIDIKSLTGFSYYIKISTGSAIVGGTITSTAHVNERIFTNIVFDTNKPIVTAEDGSSIKFASKILKSYKLKDGIVNNTHRSGGNSSCMYYYEPADTTSIKNFNNKFVLSPNLDDAAELFNDLYALESEDFPCSSHTTSQSNRQSLFYLHANDYKQFIASNCFSGYSKSIQKLIDALKATTINNAQRALIKKCFERVDENNNHFVLNDSEITNDFRKSIYDSLVPNLNAFLKHEVDYTNVTYASQIRDFNSDNGLLEFNNSPGEDLPCCISRHFIFNDITNGDFGIFRNHIANRPYKNALSVSNTGFYGCLDLERTTPADAVPYYDYTNMGGNITDEIDGSILIEEFDYESFEYSPFISCSPADENTYNIQANSVGNYVFDAGAPYAFLTAGPNGIDNIFKAAEQYVKNPMYYGLDAFGHWTTMSIRDNTCLDENYNQLNFNWNIIRKTFEGIPDDPEDPDPEDQMWNGVFYDDKVYPHYELSSDGSTKVSWLFDETAPATYTSQYAKMCCVPKSILNKPIRMHNMVRAAYNISPIAGANYGTISGVSGNVHVTTDDNFVGFIGTVAGKNTNGDIHDVHLNIKYDLHTDGFGVRYKNTPVLPYSVTKNIHIPPDPNNYEKYKSYPIDAVYDAAYEDLAANVNCVSFFNRTNYVNNPQYKLDKTYYDNVKEFRYFTSAWYDTLENTLTDDVIEYRLKPVYVIGGLVGRTIANNATVMNERKDSMFKNIDVRINGSVYDNTKVDMHSTFGSIIGKVDIQTTDTNFKEDDVAGLVSISNIKSNDNMNVIGYVDYQPIDINTVAATRDGTHDAGDNYFGAYTWTTYTLDHAIAFDINENDDIFDINLPRFANINQSSGAFINVRLPNDADSYSTDMAPYYTAVINSIINVSNACDAGMTMRFDVPEVYFGKSGPISVNAVFGSNTVFIPSYKQSTDSLQIIPSGYHSTQECLNAPNTPVRFFERNTQSGSLRVNNIANSFYGTFGIDQNIFDKDISNSSDRYFSYTYTSGMIDSQSAKAYASALNNVEIMWDYDKMCYVADFTDQDGVSGDGVDYSGKNNLVFGRSMSPTYIRTRLNAVTEETGPFTSVLFSAVGTSGEDQTNSQRFNGFLVYDNSSKDLMMYIANENGAEIDGRSYNLSFEPITADYISGGKILTISAEGN